ncbi:MAG: metal-sensitive transcriptional regulator [Candidatus Omnitrophica bacterium]|nr:metal-sensitive transcriptional regulator [Candidatus Omnitrophota bacterium]
MENQTTHEKQLEYLKKIEGQIRGVSKMIEDKRYCVDIMTQLHSVIGALYRVENEIFKKHIDGCVVGALKGKSERDKEQKIDEVIALISKFRRVC